MFMKYFIALTICSAEFLIEIEIMKKGDFVKNGKSVNFEWNQIPSKVRAI